MRHFTPGEEMRLKLIGADGDAGLGGGDAGIDDQGIGHAAQPHGEQRGKTDRCIGDACPQPEIEKLGDHQEQDESDNDSSADEEDFESGHEWVVGELGE